MEISWKWLNLYLGLLLVGICTAFPLNLKDTNTGHTQFLTGVAAVLITVGSIVLAGCLCCQRRKGFQDEKEKEFHNSPVVAATASTLDHGHTNPIANGEFTIFTPLSPPHFNNNVFLANEQVIRRTSDDYVNGDIDVSPWFDGPESDFPRIKLKYIKELGRGYFGKVVEGAAQDLDSERTWTPVIVRILDAASNARERILFLNDALFYLAPPHPNLLALKGRCLSAAPLLLLQESCSGGDLKSRLRAVGCEDNILKWCCQLTSALRHLHENGFTHPDLAARNCLLTDSLALKLGDYSLSAKKYPDDYYKGGEPLISVRWRSPESLDCTPTTIQPKTLTKEANIWSLGVVMWEICESGSQPYDGLDDDEVISRVFGHECLRLDGPSKPQMYSDYIFRLIRMCWNNAELRPKAAQIDMMLSDLLQVHKHTHEPLIHANDDFDRRWESLKPNTSLKTDYHNITIDIESDDDHNKVSKPMSPSLNNLHGSLDNLSSVPLGVRSIAGSSLSVAKVPDSSIELGRVYLESDKNIKTDLSRRTNIQFKLGPPTVFANERMPDSPVQNDSLTDSMIFKQQGSSESDTEEENWRRKVERGAYSEKVRLKSRSVADLMILTHVDYSESESETPMPSIDYKSNRSIRKSNLENSSLNFSSEGNLLNLEDTFEKELKKLQVERRDSLLFVPDNKSQNNSNLSLLHELNSPTEIKPMNQIYNIFNMTIDNFGSLRVGGSKLNDLINVGDETRVFSRQDSENKSDLGYATLHNSERNSDFGSVDGEHLLEDKNAIIKNEIEERLKNCEFLTKDNVESSTLFANAESQLRENISKDSAGFLNDKLIDRVTLGEDELCKLGVFQRTKQNLPDILASLDQEHSQVNVDLLESNLMQPNCNNGGGYAQEAILVLNDEIKSNQNTPVSNNKHIEPEIIFSSINSKETQLNNTESHDQNLESKMQIMVPKLSDLVLNNHKLIQSVSDRPHSDVEILIHKDLVSKESQIVPDLYSENIESSDSVNEYLNKKMLANKDEASNRGEEDNISSECVESKSSTKAEVYTENILLEIRQSFTKGPKILESINSAEGDCDFDIPCLTTPTINVTNEPMVVDQRNNDSDIMHMDLNMFLNEEREDALANIPKSCHESDLLLRSLNEDSSVSRIENQNRNDSTCDLNVKIDNIEVINSHTNVNNETKHGAENETDSQNEVQPITSVESKQEVTLELSTENDVYTPTYHSADDFGNEIMNNICQTFDIQNTPSKEEKLTFDASGSQKEVLPNLVLSEQDVKVEVSSENGVNATTDLLAEGLEKEVDNNLCQTFDCQNTPLKQDLKAKVAFDLSESQRKIMPNSLTHTAVFTSTPFGKKADLSLPTENVYSSLNLFGAQENSDDQDIFSSNFAPLPANPSSPEKETTKLNYSLETWDNFLGKSFDSTRESNENLFDSFTSEPQSMLFLEEDCHKDPNLSKQDEIKNNLGDTFVKGQCSNGTFIKDEPLSNVQSANDTFVKDSTFVKNETFVKDDTFVKEDKNDGTFVIDDKKNGTFVIDNSDGSTTGESLVSEHWESGGGWFLHPQSDNDKLSGDIEPQPSTSQGSYIGFGIDDEIMTAIRNELLEKLPHAQVKGVSAENVKEEEEWNQTERNEVFLRYNVYNTPLSPIPEESSFDVDNDVELVISGETTPKLNDSDSDWSDAGELEYPPAISSRTNDSPLRIPNHGHTPSQSSCCSNDTLFNFEDFGSTNDKEHISGLEQQTENPILYDDVFEQEEFVTNLDRADTIDESDEKTVQNSEREESEIYSWNVNNKKDTIHYVENQSNSDGVGDITEELVSLEPVTPISSQDFLKDFLANERNHTSSACSSLSFSIKVVAPLPSPEDIPWKSLPASLLTYDSIQKPALPIDNINVLSNNQTKLEGDATEISPAPTLEPNDRTNYNMSTASLVTKCLDQEIPKIKIDSDAEMVNNDAKDIVTYENMPASIDLFEKNDVVESATVQEKNESDTYENPSQNSNYYNVRTEPPQYENISTSTLCAGSDNMVETPFVQANDKDAWMIYENIGQHNDDNMTAKVADYENMPTSAINPGKDDLVENCSKYDILIENNPPTYENLDGNSEINEKTEVAEYENIPTIELSDKVELSFNNFFDDINNESEYVNIHNQDETKNILIDDRGSYDYINIEDQNNDQDMFGVLTDIRFSGPIDSQLMSTSFSESNDVDEQDWDSGSDTRSSSSGEFIWKEGEHEESLKALRAAPHDVLDDLKPMEEITEETTESDVSSSDEEGDNLEFVPSAWDKFATPTKSALRSPEKSLERPESKKPRGVWFKKQKYHCVYEYPREPESPLLHSHDLWKPQIDFSVFSDWEFDAESYLPPPTGESDINPSTFTFKPKINNSRRSLYYLTSPSDIQGDGSSSSSNTDEEFMVQPSSRSMDSSAAVCSQFFPGASSWIENSTPDSGLEDSTPGSMSDSSEFPDNYLASRQVLPLKKLAAQVINRNKEINKGSKDVLGGLRHTRNKLKLDLPPSPSAFTSNKTFTVEPLQEPVVLREKPTFSTFGKSRFLVQQVDTHTDDSSQNNTNVCFDVLPYKPINIIPINSNEYQENNDVTYEPLKINFDDFPAFSNKKEIFVKGEASLLDSADEDSGIESSTLERKLNTVVPK